MINKLIRKIASIFIPKNTLYCHHRFKYSRKYRCNVAKPCIFFESYGGRHYCKLLKQYLIIPDQVKDCGINEECSNE